MTKRYGLDRINQIVAAILILCFGSILFFCPIAEGGDSFQYINQFVTRDPLYPLLIQFLEAIFGEGYQFAIAVIQNGITIGIFYFIICDLRYEFQLKAPFVFACLFILLLPYGMTPLFSATNLMMTNTILTEGISIPLYLLYAMRLWQALWKEEHRKRNLSTAFCLAVVLSLIRGQMMTTILLWGLIACFLAWQTKQLKKIIAVIVVLGLTFFFRTQGVRLYNYIEQGLYVDTAAGKAMAVANVLYVSDSEDGALLKNPELQGVFEDIMEKLEADGGTYASAEKGLLNRAKHHEEWHDAINFDYLTPAVEVYLAETKGITVEQFQLLKVETDAVSAQLMKELIPINLGEYIYNYAAIAVYGFIRSIAAVHPVLNWYTLFAYLGSLGIAAFLLWKDPHSKSAKGMCLVFVMIGANVCACSFLLQCISRYMIYNLPLFYIMGLMMLIELWRRKIDYKKESSHGI